uniref:Uncharacterized protein n=1 Tax=Nelumbo nucifera TaxID=4432 RepID=A0A822ZAL5_NELNU|nr:TPA_asm: hypothetical protein HUJ06_014409 [Nelumbo nucifera]
MAESPSPHSTKKEATDLADVAAAQQLIQLSGDEETHSNGNDERNQNDGDISSSNKQEIIRKDEVVVCRPTKRRFRSIVSIYRVTKPIQVISAKKIRRR